MKPLLEQIKEYTQLAVKCALEQNEKRNILNCEVKSAAYAKLIVAIDYLQTEVRLRTTKELSGLTEPEAVND